MQRFVRVRPAQGKPKVSHPGQGMLMPGTQSAPRFIGFRRLDFEQRKAAAAELGVLPRELPEDVLFVPTGEAEVHPKRLVRKAIARGELVVEGEVVASTVGHATKALNAPQKAAEPRKPARAAKKEAD